MMILVCHVISQDEVIIWLCDFIGRSCILAGFLTIEIVVVEL